MIVQGRCEKVESVEAGLKLTIYITDEAQMDEAFRFRKKDVSLSLGHGADIQDGPDKESVRVMAETALRQALAFLYEDEKPEVPKEQQLELVGQLGNAENQL